MVFYSLETPAQSVVSLGTTLPDWESSAHSTRGSYGDPAPSGPQLSVSSFLPPSRGLGSFKPELKSNPKAYTTLPTQSLPLPANPPKGPGPPPDGGRTVWLQVLEEYFLVSAVWAQSTVDDESL